MQTATPAPEYMENISFFTTMSLFSVSLIVGIIFVIAIIKGSKSK